MSILRIVSAVVVAVSIAIPLTAQAGQITTLTLDDVATNDGGTLTGSFQMNDSTFDLSNINISLTGSPDVPDMTFTSTSQVPGFCTLCSPTSQYDEFRIEQGAESIYFDVNDPLVLNGSNILITDPDNEDQFSDVDYTFEVEDVDPITTEGLSGALDAVTSSAVPEPSSLPLLLAGLGLIGGAMYFGRKKMPKTRDAQ